MRPASSTRDCSRCGRTGILIWWRYEKPKRVCRGDVLAYTAALIFTIITLAPALTMAQSTEPPVVTVGYETSRDRFHYRFENPSNYDTAELVPHDFKQTYWADNNWLVVTARYRVGRHIMESVAAATPRRTTRGDDVDAFFLPNGDVAISGTSGNVGMRSVRVRHTMTLGESAGFRWQVGYQYRRDRSVFDARQTKTVSHTQPPSASSFTIVGSETTISDVHEVRVGVTRRWTPGPWRVAVSIDAAPTTQARLTTILPIKYPGQEIVFSANVMTLNPALTISRGRRWPVVVSVAATETLSYAKSRQFERRALSIGIGVGRRFE